MAAEHLKMKTDNSGVTVKINLFSLEEYVADFNSEAARLWMKGSALNAETGERIMFNDAGQLVTALGKWNSAKFKQLKQAAKDAQQGVQADRP